MRTTFTTAELTSRLRVPALRALEGVARQLGAPLPRPHEEPRPGPVESAASATAGADVSLSSSPSAHMRPGALVVENDGALAMGSHGPEASSGLSSRDMTRPPGVPVPPAPRSPSLDTRGSASHASVPSGPSADAMHEARLGSSSSHGALALSAEAQQGAAASRATHGMRDLARSTEAQQGAAAHGMRDLAISTEAQPGPAAHGPGDLALFTDATREARQGPAAHAVRDLALFTDATREAQPGPAAHGPGDLALFTDATREAQPGPAAHGPGDLALFTDATREAQPGPASHGVRDFALSTDATREARRGLASHAAHGMRDLALSTDATSEARRGLASHAAHETRESTPETAAPRAPRASSREAARGTRSSSDVRNEAPELPSSAAPLAPNAPATHALSGDGARTSAPAVREHAPRMQHGSASRGSEVPGAAPVPRGRSSDTSRLASDDGRGLATSPLSVSAGPRPDSSPHASAPRRSEVSAGTSPAPEGLRITVKSTEPASPKRQVVRLMRALPPSSTAMPAPPLGADATNVPAPHERASAVPLPSPAVSGASTNADGGPRPRVVPLLPPTPHARPRSRLTFAPPEAPSPDAPSSPQPALPLSREVTHAMAPLLEHARQLSVPAPNAEPHPSAPVQNTFNVSVQVGAENTATGMDRRTLEDALVDILRESARRHGLEV